MTATPLLDRQERVVVNPRHGARDLVQGLCVGVGIGLVLGLANADRAVLLWLLPAMWVAIAVHEVGHLAAGLLLGFEIRQFAAGPLVISRETRGVRFRLVAGRMFSGQVQAAPLSAATLRRDFLLFAAGGPLATALLFVALALLPGGAFATALWIVNGVAAAMSWTPGYFGGMASDGKCIQLMRSHSRDGDLLAAMLYIAALDTRGVPPYDWSPELIDRLREPGSTPLAGAATILLITHALALDDRDHLVSAVERGLALAPKMPPDLRRIVFDAAAWTNAFCRGNADLAEAWMADARAVRAAYSPPEWDASSLAAIEIARGRHAEAHDLFLRAIVGLDRRPGVSGSVRACRDRFASLVAATAERGKSKAS